jgi:hypothetical protein
MALRLRQALEAHLEWAVAPIAATALCVACATAPAGNADNAGASQRGAAPRDGTKDAPIVLPEGPTVARVGLAGARCRGRGDACACRAPGDDAESEPPAAGNKRLEIRLAADGGQAVLDSPTLGRFRGGGTRDTCYYVDVVGGSRHELSFLGKAANIDRGFAPRLMVREYGPKGPWWYDVVSAACDNGTGRCDRAGADAWGDELARRKRRGRLEPCGSAVVTGLAWQTSGGLHERDGGTFEDFKVDFALDIKKFATQFAPGSTECVPK